MASFCSRIRSWDSRCIELWAHRALWPLSFSVAPCFPDWSHVFGSESLQALESAISPKSENGIFLLENGIWKARSRAPGSGSWPWHQLYLAGGSVTIPAPAQAGHLPETHGAVQGAEQERLLCRGERKCNSIPFQHGHSHSLFTFLRLITEGK